MNRTVDVAVLGAGHAGLNALKSVRKVTDNVVLINGGPLGTTCARVGCMPSKAAIQVAADFHTRRKFASYGVSDADTLDVDTAEVMEHVRDVRDMFVDLAQANSTDAMGDQLIDGYAEFLNPDVLKVGTTIIHAKKIIIATGSRPHVPADLRAFGDRILTTDNLFEQPDLPKTLAVLGLGAIGIELGQALHRLGVSVIGITHATRIAQLRDPEINKAATEILGRELPMHLGYPYQVAEEGRKLRVTAGTGSVLVDKLLVCAGRTPNLEGLGIEKLGAALDSNGVPLFNPHTMQIGDLPVFIAGDVTGRNTTLPDAANEGLIAGYNAVQDRLVAFKQKVPLSIVFSEPNIVEVGAGWDELDTAGVAVGQIRFGPVGRAFIMRENRGLLRIYGDKRTGRILGASMVGPRTEHLAHLLAWSIQQRSTVFDLLRMPYYHPVIEEGLKDALHELAKKLDSDGGVLLGLERSPDARAKTTFGAASRPLRAIAATVRRPRYAVAATALLASAMISLSHQARVDDQPSPVRPSTSVEFRAPPPIRVAAATTPGITTDQLSRGLTRGDVASDTDTGDTTDAALETKEVPAMVNTADRPTADVHALVNRPPIERHSDVAEVASSVSLGFEPKSGRDVESAEGAAPDIEVQAVSLEASRALSHALIRYWVGDTDGAMVQLAGDGGSNGYRATDSDALRALRKSPQLLSQNYADGETAFLRGDKALAFESWREYLIEEGSLQLPTWSAFALEVKARVVDEYTMRGDEAESQGSVQAALHLWGRARSIEPGGRAAKSLERLGQRVEEPPAEARTNNTSLDQLVDIFVENHATPENEHDRG